MTEKIIVFASIHHVNAVKRRLQRDGIFVEMVRTPQSLAHTGCGFALCCGPPALDAVLSAAVAAGVTHGGVFDRPAAADNRFYASPAGSDEEA